MALPSVIKEMIFTIRVSFCVSGLAGHQRARMQAHAATILAYVLFLNVITAFSGLPFKFERAFWGTDRKRDELTEIQHETLFFRSPQ